MAGDSNIPSDLNGLFRFYTDYVRLLYGAVQAKNELPQEALFEINAAFDHVSRIYALGDDESQQVEKAYSHLKRSCLDIFKLKVKETIDNYNDLRRVDTSIIDNGDFDREMHRAIEEIRRGSLAARQEDIVSKPDDGAGGFARWADVYKQCQNFDAEFFRNEKVHWARSKQRVFTLRQLLFAVGTGVIAGVLVTLLFSR